MTDPHPHQSGPEGSTILLQADVKWVAVINQPAERPSIVLVADREAVLVKAQPSIEAPPCARQEHL